MSSYIILTDGAIDLLLEDRKNPSIRVIPMNVQLEDEIFPINGQESPEFLKEFYKRVEDGCLPTTSMIPSYLYEEYFEACTSQGMDVLYVSMSGKISGTFEQSLIARKNIQDKFPLRKVICLDSLTATYSGGLLLHRALKNLESGLSLEDNVSQLEKIKRNFFAVGLAMSLAHLHRGGRLSASSAFFGTALNIKPIVYFDAEGSLVPLTKARGLKRGLKELVNIQKESGNPTSQKAILSHCENKEDASRLKELLLAETKLTDIDILPMSPIIGAHLGPHSLVFSFLGDRESL